MAKDPEKEQEYKDLASAVSAVAEQKEIIAELSEEIAKLEDENAELRLKTLATDNKVNCVIEFAGENFKANAASYHSETGIVVLNKDVLEEKQKIFGAERVRLATDKDLKKLIEEKSNLISKIEK